MVLIMKQHKQIFIKLDFFLKFLTQSLHFSNTAVALSNFKITKETQPEAFS